ncbi:MAG: rhodanese-like domain-containing protein [bacterium]
MKEINSQDLHRLKQVDSELVCIDVRSKSEFDSEYIQGFKHIALDQLSSHLDELKNTQQLVFSCASGFRSRKACELLKDHPGNMMHLAGGIAAWKAAGLETIKGTRNSISVMRQVQIVVGFGVLAGVLLAQFYNPHFIWLSAFFGAGLLFAGLSNTCMLALLLAKMPWNR